MPPGGPAVLPVGRVARREVPREALSPTGGAAFAAGYPQTAVGAVQSTWVWQLQLAVHTTKQLAHGFVIALAPP
jgi:hypothetical protein